MDVAAGEAHAGDLATGSERAPRTLAAMSEPQLTHLDALGRAQMVDVTPKAPTARRALAVGTVRMRPETAMLIAEGGMKKGDVLGVARIAAIQAAKRTSELIPLCHAIAIGGMTVSFRIDDDCVEVAAEVETVDRTGVEMEALTAVSVACLTIYDMCKAVDRGMTIDGICLVEKDGGRSGRYVRGADPSTGSDDGATHRGDAAAIGRVDGFDR